MIGKLKFGNLKRLILGFVQNKFGKAPPIPGLINFEINKSINGLPIKCFKVGNGKTKLLYVFGIHGNEVGTVRLAYHFLSWLNENKSLLNNISLFVIPCLNPDGYYLAQKTPDYLNGGKVGRFNARGVDLNRNFDTPTFKKTSNWSFGKNYSESSEVYCGEFGNSEPEVKGLVEFIAKEKIKTLFMFHNSGKDVLGNKYSAELAKVYSEKSGFSLISENEWLDLKQTGTAKEWADNNGIAYLEIEGSSRWGSDWDKQKEAILATILINNSD